MFTEEILEMLFSEAGIDLNAWIDNSGYTSEWTDQQIYAALPDDVIALLGEFDLNASWMHGGM